MYRAHVFPSPVNETQGNTRQITSQNAIMIIEI